MNQKNVSVSEQTKRELAAALKEAMAQKPLDKITISELTSACSIRRQSFYYHFEDIYDLLRCSKRKPSPYFVTRKDLCCGKKGCFSCFTIWKKIGPYACVRCAPWAAIT